MFFRKRNYRRRGLRRGARRTNLRRKKVSKVVKSYVKKQIHRQIENKERIVYAANNDLTATSYSTQSVGLLPSIPQGLEVQSRIGNQIKIVNGVIKGHFNIKPYNATTNPNVPPVWVRILLVKNLRLKSAAQYLNSTDLAQIFRGNGTALAQQNNMLDMELPINDDLFRVLGSKMFKLGTTGFSTLANDPISSGSYHDMSNMSKPFYFNWGKYVKSALKFDDNDVDYYPQNNNLFLVFLCAHADGTTNAYTPVEYHYVNHVKFEDA